MGIDILRRREKEGEDSMSADEILVIVIISIVFICYIFTLLKYDLKPIMRLEYIKPAKFIGIIIVGLIIAYLFLNLENIQPNSWVLISLYAGLVGITLVYAVGAHRQANASYEMAKEMREQKFESVRPIIEIQRGGDTDRRMSEEVAGSQGHTGYGLSCKISNIGLGPALEIKSLVKTGADISEIRDFGVLTKGEKIYTGLLSQEQEDSRKALVVIYNDIYGREFESSREVGYIEYQGWELSPLKISVLKGDLHDD